MRTWKPDPTSRRTTPRPTGWKALRDSILVRDGRRCTWITTLPDGGHWTLRDHPDRCVAAATDVDHVGDADDHDPDKLRSLCSAHHKGRTGKQAAAARWSRAPRKQRPTPPHPGLM